MTHLKEGDLAPFFEGFIDEKNKISIEDFMGSKIILYFYPKDMTPGCTAQACNLEENQNELKEKGFKIVGVSADSIVRHGKFTAKHNLTFPLISDEDKEICNAYGVWGPKKMAGREYEGINRTTFIIGEDLKIEKVFTKVKTKDHTNQILNEYK